MATSIVQKFRRELGSFYELTVVNIAFGAIAMALGVSIGVQAIKVLLETRSLLFLQLTLTLIGFLAFGISLKWLLSSVEVLDGLTDINDYYKKREAR